MSITLVSAPIVASSKLGSADIQALIAAISPVVTLPQGESLANAKAVNIVVNEDGTGSLNIRFSK
jgi:hypothetical protein